MTIRGKSIVLRPIKLSDAPRFVGWINDPAVGKPLQGHKKRLTLKMETKWIKSLSKNKNQRQFAIDTIDGVHIGSIGLRDISSEWNNAKFGILIGNKRYWGRGYGTEATKLLMHYAFSKLKLHKIELGVYDFNKRAIKLYKKLGFKVEGVRKDHIFYGGRYYDAIQMGLFKKSFKYK